MEALRLSRRKISDTIRSLCKREVFGFLEDLFRQRKSVTELLLQSDLHPFKLIAAHKIEVSHDATATRRVAPSQYRGQVGNRRVFHYPFPDGVERLDRLNQK